MKTKLALGLLLLAVALYCGIRMGSAPPMPKANEAYTPTPAFKQEVDNTAPVIMGKVQFMIGEKDDNVPYSESPLWKQAVKSKN
ncbi:MAG: hypothetical protein V4438_03735 [Patescibacteria group bacterium]